MTDDRDRGLHPLPLDIVLGLHPGAGDVIITMRPTQWDSLLERAYNEYATLLVLDEHERPIRAWRRPPS